MFLLLFSFIIPFIVNYPSNYLVDAFSVNRQSFYKIDTGTCSTHFTSTSSHGGITKLYSSSSSPSEGYDDDLFASLLQSRINQVSDQETKLPLVVLDSMLPRQILKLEIKNKLLLELLNHRLKRETPTLGMIGTARLRSGEVVNLNTGVEVEINVKNKMDDDDNDNKYSGLNTVEFVAGRRFNIEGGLETTEGGWTEGRVKFLDSKAEEENELRANIGFVDPVVPFAKAYSLAKQLTSPNANLPENVSLIQRWIELAKEREHQEGQIEKLLLDLGDRPKEDEPSELAFWVGALINPLPAMGVSMEVRPALLTAKSAGERVEIVLVAILRSIKHMDGSAPMW
mmetsp:Transcript_5537/g.7085  ORF Transcript_5537/g.7085 Transcript_5537/m.7085 type:complete len:341 (+) Transcript_5537:203-1225(+)